MGQIKILFLVSNGPEVRLANAIQKELAQHDVNGIISVSSGTIDREKSDQDPEEVLRTCGMPFRRLTDYGTMDVTQILRIEQPEIVIVGSDSDFLGRAFIYAANSLGIPVLLLRLGISNNVVNTSPMALRRTTYRLTHNLENILLKYSYMIRTLIGSGSTVVEIAAAIIEDVKMAFSVYDSGGGFGCQAIAVAGSWEKHVLTERGVKGERIFVTGNPEFPAATMSGTSSYGRLLRQDLGIGQQDKVILLLTSAKVEHGHWSRSKRSIFIKSIIKSLSSLIEQEAYLVIKIHPVENLDEYSEIVGSGKKRIILRKDLSLYDVISISDVVMTGYSTTVLEACSLHKPVILLNTFSEPEYLPYVEMGLAKGVYGFCELKPVVENMLYNATAKEEALERANIFLDKNKQSFDGQSAARIVNLILKLVQKVQFR